MKIADSITDLIGNTPPVRLSSIGKEFPAEILLKIEFFYPLSSIKDHIGLAMIKSAEKEGLIKQNTIIIEPTSCNTGIALAFVCDTGERHLSTWLFEDQ
jgi:cysteine synthase A